MSGARIILVSVLGLALIAAAFVLVLRPAGPAAPAGAALPPERPAATAGAAASQAGSAASQGGPAASLGGAAASQGGAAALQKPVTVYTCSMHPDVIRKSPGSCPICGMDLVAVREKAPLPAYGRHPGDDGTVQVSRGFLQNFAVRTAEVQSGPLTVSIRAVGILEHDEAKIVSVNTKFAGWIEQARVHNIGETVARGDVLFEVYSPQVLATQREYLAAVQYVQRLRRGGAYEDAVSRAESLLGAARERLRNWDVAGEQIDALDSVGEAPRTVQVLAPAAGFIVAKAGDSLEGMRVSPGMTVLKIADHSTLWAKAEFDEEDLRHVREGNRVSIDVDAFPGRRWEGRILFFRSAVNRETRALTAYVEVANPDLVLRPMMDVTVSAQVEETADAVLAPVESVLHSGKRALVIVARGGGSFEPREVQLGRVSEGMQQVSAGLYPGERVVVSSQFLIASESDLKAAISQLLSEDAPAEYPADRAPAESVPAGALPHRH